MTSEGILVPLHNAVARSGTFVGSKKEAIINGILFPIVNMKECAYNASCCKPIQRDAFNSEQRLIINVLDPAKV